MRSVAAALVLIGAFSILNTQAAKPCNKFLRTKVENGSLTEDGGLRAQDGLVYAKGTFWKEGDFWWACPCLGNKPCLRICKKEMAFKAFNNQTFENEINRDVKITVWKNHNSNEVTLLDHFATIQESICKTAVFLDVNEEPSDEHIILANGSLQFTFVNLSAEFKVPQDSDRFCVTRFNDTLRAFTCNPDEPPVDYRFYLYPPFFIISTIFLALTLLAYHLAREAKSLHNKTIRSQSAALFLVYLGLTVTYITGRTSHIAVCVLLTYTNYYFLMASFFWLNVMCVDIFITFRSLTRTNAVKYWQASLYAWGIPFLFLIFTIIIDKTTTGPLSPQIGVKSCWFHNHLAQFIYFHGPVMILLVINLVFFGLTANHLWQVRKETKRAFQTGDSRIHSNLANKSKLHNDRFILFLKLFLLMGCTWLMEIISWAVGGDESFWFLTDIVNSLRGLLIFWFCVWSKKPVRDALLEKPSRFFNCGSKKEDTSPRNSTEMNTGTTPVSGSSSTLAT